MTMTRHSSNDRILDGVYASLSPLERARVLARASRERDGREVERLRRTALTQTARGEIARGMRIIARLHGTPIAMLVATRLGIERDTLLLGWAATRALDQQRTWLSLLSLWSLIDHPVTASEYAAIAAIEREELESLDA